MKRSGKNSIRRKVAGRVVKAIIITVILLSVVDMIYLTRRTAESQQEHLRLATHITASDINSWITGMEGITVGMADSIEAMGILDDYHIKRIINRIADTHPELKYVYMATEEGKMYMARGVSFAAGVDPRERIWYKDAKEAGETTIIDPYISATTPDIMMATVATPVFMDYEMVGVVAVDAEISYINEYVNSLRYENGAYGFLIDSKGNIISHPNGEYNPTPDNVVNAKEALPELEKLLITPGGDFIEAKDYRDHSMLYMTEKIDDCDWIVGMAFPRKIIAETIDRGIRISLFVALICIVLATADMTAAIRKILSPIEKINPVLDDIVQGKFETKVDFDAGDDEIGEMQVKLAAMINTLSNVIAHEKYILGEMEHGNLAVDDMEELKGDLNDISISVNSIKSAFNDIISDIQFSAINLQSFAMGINETSNIDEMRSAFEELSAEANILMEKTSRFITVPPEAKE